MAAFVWFAAPSGPGRLLIVLHHLVVDGVSWRVLFEDFAAIHAALSAPDELHQLGVAGAEHALTHHTYTVRMGQLLELCASRQMLSPAVGAS